MALQKAGLSYENEGLSAFLRGVENASNAIEGFGRAAGRVGGSVSSFGQVAIGAFREIGSTATRAAVDLGRAAASMAVDMGGKALGSAMDLQDSMNLLGATSEATAEDLDKLKRLARDLGADLTLPATSAADAGTAMLELSKAGLSVNQVMGAAKGTLQLAAAANITEAEAAEIASNALNAFRLSGEKAGFVADLLANAANKSSLEIKDAADSFKMASSVFAAFQAPVVGSEQAMTDLTTAIALLGNAGIKGSDAGTSLKQMLLQLAGPSQIAKEKMQALALAAFSTNTNMEDLTLVGFGNAKERSEGLSNILATTGLDLAKTGDIAFDAAGKMRPLKDIINLVTLGTKNMTDEQRANYLTSIFGADATRAVITLMQAGPAEFDKMTAAITKQGGAASLAAARTAGLRGAWDGFKSVLETVGMVLAQPFLKPLEDGVRRLAAEVNRFPIDRWASNTAAALDKLILSAQNGAFAFGTISQRAKIFGMELGRDVVTAVTRAIPEMLEAGKGLGNAAIQWATDMLPELQRRMETLAMAASLWAEDAIPLLIPRLMDYRNQAIGFILSNAPMVVGSLHQWSLALLGWIEQAAPGMIQTFGEKTTDLVRTIGSYTPAILSSLGDWALALVQWIVEAAPGMLRNLATAAGGVVDEIGRQLPGIVDALASWGDKLVNWVIEAAPGLFSELLKLNAEFLQWVVDRVPGIAAQLGEWATRFVEWLGPVSGKLIIALGEMLGTLTGWIIDNAPGLSSTLGEWASAFGMWIWEKAIPNLLSGLAGLGTEIINWISAKATDIAADGSVGRALVDGLKGGVSDTIGGVGAWLSEQWGGIQAALSGLTTMATDAGGSLIDGLKSGIQGTFSDLWGFSYQFFDDTIIKRFRELTDGAWTIGQGLVDGIKQGLQDHWSGFLKDMQDLVNLLPEGIRKILGISSPSKVGIEMIGKPFAEGIGIGFLQGLMEMQQSMSGAISAMATPQIVQPAISAAGGGSGSSSVTNNSQSNYYYSPTYGSAPRSPVQDFAVMKAFGS